MVKPLVLYVDKIPETAEEKLLNVQFSKLYSDKVEEFKKLVGDFGIPEEVYDGKVYVAQNIDSKELMLSFFTITMRWKKDDVGEWNLTFETSNPGLFRIDDYGSRALTTYNIVSDFSRDIMFIDKLKGFFEDFASKREVLLEKDQKLQKKRLDLAIEMRETDIEIENDNIDVDVATMKYAFIDDCYAEDARYLYRKKPVVVIACSDDRSFPIQQRSVFDSVNPRIVECCKLKKIKKPT